MPLSGRAAQRRRLAVLALLAVARERGISRDKLMAYLWPDQDGSRGRHALSQLLYAIRRDFGDDCIIAGIDDLRLNAAVVATDIADFEEAIAAGEMERAVAAYAGPFLDGFFVNDAPDFERWVDETRRRYAALFAQSLDALAAGASARGDIESATVWLGRRIAADPMNPEPVLQAMRARAALGDRAGAVQYGRSHSALIELELGVAADARISEIITQLLAESDAGRRPGDPVLPDRVTVAERTPALAEVASPAPVPSRPAPAPARRVNARWARRLSIGLVAVAAGVLVARPLITGWRRTHIGTELIVFGAISGPDSSLSMAVREIIGAELAAAPGVRVLSPAAIEQTLSLMKLDAHLALTDSVVVDVAQRRGIPLSVTAVVTPVGTGAEIIARLHHVTGDAVTTELVATHADSADGIAARARQVAATLLGRLHGGQTPARLDSLPAVSTSSLPALRAYALARRAAASGDRWSAVHLAEAAIGHDSDFVMAHYLLGDQYWFLDRQSLSDRHLTRAARLSDRIPLRERLLVRARYAQIVRDDLDSARTYWYQLQAAFPREALAYEGRAWTHRAAGEMWDAFVAADSALKIDPDAKVPNENNKLQALLSGRPDTARALAYADSLGPWAVVQARRMAALVREDWDAALQSIDETYPPTGGCGSYWAAPFRQTVLLAANRVADAARELEVILCWARGPGGWPHSQMTIPNALLSQARAEVAFATTRVRALQYARRALDFVDSADISPPAIARMTERAADIAARGGDAATVERARRILLARDAGRQLRSYRLALHVVDAADAYLRRDYRSAASSAELGKQRTYFARSNEIAYLLEADARELLGEHARADSLYSASQAPGAYFASSPHGGLLGSRAAGTATHAESTGRRRAGSSFQ